MMERFRALVPKDFVDNELAELKAHRLRVGFLLLSMCALLLVLALDSDNVPTQTVELEPAVDIEPVEIEDEVDPIEPSDRRTEIIGLARASEGAELINPFAVDLPKPPPAPVIIPIVSAPPSPVAIYDQPPLDRLAPIVPVDAPIVEPDIPRVSLSLKGTAISDDKKLAVVHREVVGKSDGKSDVRAENRVIKLGEELDGRKVVEIGKNFIAFDNGERLELPRVQRDD